MWRETSFSSQNFQEYGIINLAVFGSGTTDIYPLGSRPNGLKTGGWQISCEWFLNQQAAAEQEVFPRHFIVLLT
jgi:hypothetical protein